MRISLFSKCFFFICILSTFCLTDFTLGYIQCLKDQKDLLLELKNDFVFNSSMSTKLVQWNGTEDCCTWNGVECDSAGHVISLQLDNETISGDKKKLSSLFSLSYLEKLNLADNDLGDIQIPRRINNLTHLTHLNLSDAGFEGQVPFELSLMQRLVSLVLSYNSLRIENPNLKSLFHNLTNLRELYLDVVNISSKGSEWCRVISSALPHLRILSLGGCSLSGPLDSSLSQLRSLSILHLDGNNFSTIVPTFFANFSRLTTLSLGYCFLQGIFPEMIFQIPTLQNLDLDNNMLLSGTLPEFHPNNSFRTIMLYGTNFSGTLPDSISNLRMLSEIDVFGCKFTGSIPLQSLFSLPLLEKLGLCDNRFSGQINEFSKLQSSNLNSLDLSRNCLEGPIPKSFFKFEKLEALVLNNNFFNGTFELENIQRLHHLSVLDLSYNKLSVDASSTNSSFDTFPRLDYLGLASCNLYIVPEFIRNLSELTRLDLSNNQITGEIPSWIWEIGNGRLKWLNLSSNMLSDELKPYHIPPSILILDLHSNQLQGELPMLPYQVSHVDFSNNNFRKLIPPNFVPSNSYISSLYLANNSLSGVIPTSLCNATSLKILDISINNLSGSVPPCLVENMTDLVVLNLGINNISGVIPNKFPVNCSLQTLDLSYNNLGGNIPVSLAKCKSLEVVNVGNNKIQGIFPCMLTRSLRVLVLRSNIFHGHVRCQKGWTDLQIIDIASNNFSGYLYSGNFLSWRGMMLGNDIAQLDSDDLTTIYVSTGDSYQVKVSLVAKGQEREYVKIWTSLTSVDFSFNNFQGEIPEEIGQLNSLYILNLSHNSLTGTIPKSVGNLTQLGSLDFSVNHLTGVIPQELAALTFLSALNLSYNKFVGPIPRGRQLQTFSEASFEGNSGLCGFPLNKTCKNMTENGGKINDLPSNQKSEIEWDYVAAALGFVVGLGSIIWLLFGFRTLSEKFSERVDGVLEKLFARQDRRRRQSGRVLRKQVVRRH